MTVSLYGFKFSIVLVHHWRAADVSALAPSGSEFNEDEYQKFVRMLSDDELIKAGKRLRVSCGDVVTRLRARSTDSSKSAAKNIAVGIRNDPD